MITHYALWSIQMKDGSVKYFVDTRGTSVEYATIEEAKDGLYEAIK